MITQPATLRIAALALAGLLSLFVAPRASIAQVQHRTTVTIAGVAAPNAAALALDLVSVPQPPDCAVPVFKCFITPVECLDPDGMPKTAAQMAAELTAEINAACGGLGYTAANPAAGTLTVTGPADTNFGCRVSSSDENPGCRGGTGYSLPNAFGAPLTVNNVCDAQGGNDGRAAQAGGFQFSKTEESIPMLPHWGLMLFAALLLAASLLLVQRRFRSRI